MFQAFLPRSYLVEHIFIDRHPTKILNLPKATTQFPIIYDTTSHLTLERAMKSLKLFTKWYIQNVGKFCSGTPFIHTLLQKDFFLRCLLFISCKDGLLSKPFVASSTSTIAYKPSPE